MKILFLIRLTLFTLRSPFYFLSLSLSSTCHFPSLSIVALSTVKVICYLPSLLVSFTLSSFCRQPPVDLWPRVNTESRGE